VALMSEIPAVTRLPRNFHKTFKPERQYISAMLSFAAAGGSGNYLEISRVTGIPTGKSSGKVPAILDYCRGMGLLRLSEKTRSAVKKPELTDFGRIVLLEDPFLKTEVSQWMAHLQLCRPLFGADVWYHTFFAGSQGLGATFSKEGLESYLKAVYGVSKGNGLIGPLFGTYDDEAALKTCGALIKNSDGSFSRRPAPIVDEFTFAYGAWLLQLLQDHFPDRRQVSEMELNTAAGWRTIPAWDSLAWKEVLRQVEQRGLLDVDRNMEPWLLSPQHDLGEAWRSIYNDMI